MSAPQPARNHYLTGEAQSAAHTWLCENGMLVSDEPEILEPLIEAFYPGGLHFFICANLSSAQDGQHVSD